MEILLVFDLLPHVLLHDGVLVTALEPYTTKCCRRVWHSYVTCLPSKGASMLWSQILKQLVANFNSVHVRSSE